MFKIILSLLFVSFFITQCALPEAQDDTSPVVTLVYPTANSVITSNFTIKIEASDDDKISSVWAYLDGNKTVNTSSQPYEIAVDITGYTGGLSHDIAAYAVDKSGNLASSGVISFIIGEAADKSPPTLLVLYPVQNSIVSDTVNIVADIRDNVAVTRAEFFIDGILKVIDSNGTDGWSTTWDTNLAGTGSHSIFIKAYDAAENVGSSTLIIVTVL